ncbi:MAG TPA: tetratricopeptide repeat protein, partial [Candidatus Krumholzibacteria bacterium]|nr:tetratricopeptide repeat protein [Candidatus Krumholzibacteria bacterium]
AAASRSSINVSMLVNWEKDVAMADPTPEALARKIELREQAIIAVTLIPDADTQGHLVLGYALHAVGELERAADHFEMAAEDKDLRRTARVQQSICLDEAGQPGRAKRALEILRREFPDDPEVANSLGYFLAEKGEDLERADALVAQALKDQPANGAFLDSMGWVRYRQGRAEDALDYLIRAVNVLPNDPVILEHLGMVLQAVGQPVEAGNAFRRALEAGGDPGRLNAAVAAADSAAAAARP